MSELKLVAMQLIETADSIPGIELLKRLLRERTPDREKWFDDCADMTDMIAVCFHARMNGHDDPLDALGTEISKILHECVNLTVDINFRLWELCQTAWPVLKKKADNRGVSLPFDSARSLFLECFREDRELQFELCFLPYAEFSLPKMQKAASVMAKLSVEDLLHSEQKAITRNTRVIVAAYPCFRSLGLKKRVMWKKAVIAIAITQGRKNNLLKIRLENLEKAIDDLYALQARIFRRQTDEAKESVGTSFALCKGKVLRSSRDSTYTDGA